MGESGQRITGSPVFGFLLATAISLGIYAVYGFEGWLYRDDAIYLYAGQQFADGVAPYLSIFDHKTPLTPILSGLFVSMGRFSGLEDVLAVRAGWWVMSGLAGGFIYLLGRLLYRNALAGLIGAMAFTGFWSFGREAVSGPRAKTPFVLFEVAFLYFAARQRWGWAGFFAALATWVWQPGVVYVLFALLAPLLIHKEDRELRFRGLGYAAIGVFVPCLVLFGYFISKGALVALIDGSVVFNLTYLDRPPFDVIEHLLAPVESLFKGYTLMAVPAIMGLFYLLLQSAVIYRHPVHRVQEWPVWLPIVGTLPFVFLWTFLDFQGAADLYPFLPYMAIGMAGLFWKLSEGVCSLQGLAGLTPKRVGATVAALLALSSVMLYHGTSEDGLKAQRVSAEQVAERFPGETQIASIGLPELLVLSNRSNVNPYGFIIAGIDRKIMAQWPGGISGFIRSMESSGVEAVGIGPTEGEYKELLFEYLQQTYKKERFGYFDVYVRIKVPDKSSDP
ncbi:MAG: ArnT family glycosyltransferase [Puniceicoccaceae bacterium]